MIQYIYPDGKIENEPYRKFNCNELKRLVCGWFMLTCVDDESDFYMCFLDTYGMKISELPEYNQTVKRLYDRDVYGMAIIAPSSAFN